jgi:hypothetical protein
MHCGMHESAPVSSKEVSPAISPSPGPETRRFALQRRNMPREKRPKAAKPVIAHVCRLYPMSMLRARWRWRRSLYSYPV